MVGLVNVGFLGDLPFAHIFQVVMVDRLVPQERTALQLLRVKLGLVSLELINKLGRFGAVVWAAEYIHGNYLVAAF
jgi:hypothetical protein